MRRKTEVIAEDLHNESDRISGLLSEAVRGLKLLLEDAVWDLQAQQIKRTSAGA